MDWHLAMMDMFRVYCQCARRVRAADKPLVLIERGLKETFVRTDYHFFMALIFGMVYCTYDAMGLLARQRQRASSKLDIGGVIVHVRRYKSDRDTSIIVLKFETRAWKRLLTKLEVERLAAGYPPFYREQVSIRPDAAVRPIQSEDDVARGGWVVAAGFSRMDPVPLYIDVRPFRRRCSRTESGGVFWRSFERVKAILAGPISEAFPDDDDVKQVLDAVTYMIKIESDSGGMSYISRSPLWGLDMSSLTQEQYAMAVQLYNGPPRVTQEEVDSIREKFQPILGYVLMAAFLGVEKCLKYVKNPGREMERILPQGVDTASELYLLGC
ncbi:hypothetical protein DL98DRAFT_509500 [Cadophora sp. DSE1049]|nr:hypothetical protein DL98DRAFT_509500 [Cadophora sp. DSE1049]